MVNLVIDASAGFELVLDTQLGRELTDRLPSQGQWWVPEHYFVEVAAAIRRAEHRAIVPRIRADAAIAHLQAAKLHRVQVRPLLREAWQHRGHLTIADAIYVVLAHHLNATLVTADEKLARSPGLTLTTITPRSP